MAAKLRIQYPGAIYHAINRGDRRESFFLDDNDRTHFLETLGEACQKTDRPVLRSSTAEDEQVHVWRTKA